MSPSNDSGDSNGHHHTSGHSTTDGPSFNGSKIASNIPSNTNGSFSTKGIEINGIQTSEASSLPNGKNGTHSNGPEIYAHTPIAICGMGVRLPGGIRSSSDLFDFLASKGDARNVVPEDRYNVDAFYDPSGRPGSVITKYGYYLNLDLAQFDASMFGISNAELSTMDPSQRLLLEVTREAFESAGEADFRGRNIGTFVGDFTEDWQDMQNIDLLNHKPYLMIGKSDFALSNRIAFEYDLLGPSASIKTACSATASAVHQAVMSIRSGSCPSAIVAGANLILTPRTSISMSMLGLLAPDGNCKTFDANANGFARGESVCALYLKRLDDAVRDGNPIRAVIRACNSNADGGDGSRTFGTPNAMTQAALIRQTYSAEGLRLEETKVVELHGTGTRVGDPLETSAIADCFGGHGNVYIGSVKPNLGHGEGASALTSIIKSVMALENKTILPNIKFEKPNPNIPWDRNLHVPIEPLRWPEGARERISINSFGLGGSNVHMVLDSADSMGVPSRHRRRIIKGNSKRKSLLLLSGNSAPAISELAAKYGKYLEQNPTHLESMVYTLASRRERLKLASYCIADGLTIGEPAAPSGLASIRQVAFVFTGQGAQWVGMGHEMMLDNVEFAMSIRYMDQVLKSLEQPPGWTLEELLLADSTDKNLLTPTDRSQPICAAVQIAYVDALAAWNIKPWAVVGHSSGEVAAAYAAGVLTRREAIIAAYYRGYACVCCKTSGTMAAVGMGRDKVEQHLNPGVVLACENSNTSVTISGDLKAVEETIDSLKRMYPDLFIRQLRVPMAYHSHHTATIADLYKSLVEPHLVPKPPQVPFYSTVYGKQISESTTLDAQYWQLNIESPVLFRTAVSQMLADIPNTAHLEIGPHSALAGPLRQIYKETGRSAPYTSVAERGQDTYHTFLRAIGDLYCVGMMPQIPVSENAATLPDLPTYPWNYKNQYWSETRMMEAWRFRKHRNHELLGQRILESSDLEPAWRNLIKLNDVPWLVDHCVEKDIVFPAAGYIAMAGAAVSQLMGSTAYTVQHVNIAAAKVLDDSKSIELVTTLRKHSLTASTDSKWWEFSISSESKGIWIKHCWGLVTHERAVALPSQPQVTPLARKVDAKRWYQTLSRTGLNYSNRFVGLEKMTASPVDMTASVSIPDRQDEGEAYALHPSTLDIVLQSWSVAATSGEYRKLDKMFLPTFIEQFYVGANGSQKTLRVRTTARESTVSALGDSFGVTSDGEVAFVMNGFRGTRIDGSIKERTPESSAWSVQWHPSFPFTSPEQLIRPASDMTASCLFAEQFGLLCAVEIHHVAATVTSIAQPFFNHFLAGVAKQLDRVDQGDSKVPGAVELKALNHEARLTKLMEWHELANGDAMENTIEALWRATTNMKDILEGRKDFLDIILADEMLQKVYNSYNTWSDNRDFFRVLGLNKPQLRILEIGAGTGSLTAVVLEALHSDDGERLYGDYTITDVSAGFLNQTKERFSQYQDLKYSVCDISVDPLEQGFKTATYDLILASNVLHATPDLNATLRNCRKLLKSDGQLYLQEVCSDMRYPDLVFGLFEGWWVGIEDNRVHRPLISENEWDLRLRQTGFQGIRSSVRDNDHPDFFTVSNIVAQAQPTQELCSEDSSMSVTLVKPQPALDQFGLGVKNALEAAGYALDEYIWGSKLPHDQPIVSLMDVDNSCSPLLANIDADNLASFIDMVGDVSCQAVIWPMRSAQTECQDPQYGKMLGMARCIRSEMAIDFVTLELDKLDSEATQAVTHVLSNVQQAQKMATEHEDSLDIESEYVWRNGEMLISRIHTLSVDKALADAAPQVQGRHLTLEQPGMLQSMSWTGHALPPVASENVQVRITVAALNFHDIAEAMGIMEPEGYSDSDGYHGLGCEATAIVTAVGGNVKHVSVGDRVIFMEMPTGVFATEVQVPAALVVRAPTNVNDEDAAGLLIPYATVLWCLVEKAHMKPGQKLLIHSAAGGVGIAAIHVARWLGADFYCTVGSQDKVDWLNSEFSIPRDRIFHSRDDSFVADVMRVTDGVGVDVVLNSLSGELLHASWKCVATEGCMLDLGKRDFLGRGRLAMRPFTDNRAFFGIDIAALATHSKQKVRPLLDQVVELLEDEKILPLRPTTVFDAEKVQDAFRYMQKGVHRGRIVIRMPHDPEVLPVASPSPKPVFNPDAVYMLSGGMGGLGRSTLSWMVSHGARHLAVLSPSAGTKDEHREFVKELSERGCELHCFAGDVGDYKVVRKVIAAIQEEGRPIKGVLQLAMVLRDSGFINLDHDGWIAVTNPKVQGTWNLHNLLPIDLDFFVMFGSTSGTLGAYGQANYAASNSFLDSFTHFRHSLGLPAAVLDIAAVGDVGYVASTKDVAERLERAITKFMSEGDFLRGLHLVIERSAKKHAVDAASTSTMAYQDASQVVLYNETSLPLSDPQNTTSWRRDPRLSVFRNNQGATAKGDETAGEGFRSFVTSLSNEPQKLDDPATVSFLAQEIAKRISTFLMMDQVEIDTSSTLSAMGADSLVAIEIRNWWKQAMGVEITVLELSDKTNTMIHLGALAVKRLKEKFLSE
ncbi:putative polyketide synthase [Mariannaea sp. PMI_226]|nr:putative polyketide synthase [Mariannaea sp. PMI_226]